MSAWFANGRVAGLVLAVIAVEFVVLASRRRWSGRGLPVTALALGLLPGAALVLALRAALLGARWQAVAPWLALAGLAHIADLRARIRSARERPPGPG